MAFTRPTLAGRRRQVGSLCGMGRRLSGVGPRVPRLAVRLPADVWQQLFTFLWRTAEDATDTSLFDVSTPQQAVVHQLLAGELPLTLAHLVFEHQELSDACQAGPQGPFRRADRTARR